MNERPPFDSIRWSFYLVASVIGVHALVVLSGAGLCVYHAVSLLTVTTEAPYQCDVKGRLGDLLAGALAAALAFAGGFTRGGRPPDPPKDPPP